jgi:predicted naringenin-chalcone synthase
LRPSFLFENFHCEILPQSSQKIAWHIGDEGFEMKLSSYIPYLIESGIGEFVRNMLDKNMLNLDDIDIFAIHPGGMKILQACENALNIKPEQNQYSHHIMQNYGNMSSVTTIFVLNEILSAMSPENQGDNILALTFGPGVTVESVRLKVNVN